MVSQIRELFDFIDSDGKSVYHDYGESRAASTIEEPRHDI
jgi:hypothetical protein